MMKIEMMAIGKVVPYPANPRRNQAAIDAVATSIKEFGWNQPIVVDEDMVILVGHTRLAAALQLRQKKVPVFVQTGLDEAKKRAYRIADNKTAEFAEWDWDLLAQEMERLNDGGYDLTLTGFDETEIEDILSALEEGEGEKTPPDGPDQLVPVVPRAGDVWCLGPHRLQIGGTADPDEMSGVDVILRRWQTYTGNAAMLDGADMSFDQVEDDRRKSKKTEHRGARAKKAV